MQTAEIVSFFSKLIEKELGILYEDHNLYQLQNRLEEVMKVLQIEDLETLYRDAQTNNPRFKKQILLDIATNNETSFFRDPRVFRSMERVLNELITSCESNGEKLKIWSVASSTGQEPLSIAIMVEEILHRNRLTRGYKIYCTDISERVLQRAKDALYSELEVQRGLSDQQLAKYFYKEGEKWKANSKITEHLIFEKQNLLDEFKSAEMFNMILCRNVLIYQRVEKKKEILARMSNALVPGGYLIMGAGESLIGLSLDFEQEVIDGAVFYRKKR
jgi:chemotaxis protein methyltransferase CheR